MPLSARLSANYGILRSKDAQQVLAKGKWMIQKDYRRAALELLDSRDFNRNINNRNTRGVAIRRRDAAIELSQLAEAMIKK